ncbi:hypothetical protein SGRIM128S_05080 [Streptomyces griseomycini]
MGAGNVIRKMGIDWQLRIRMAEKGMFQTTNSFHCWPNAACICHVSRCFVS